MSLTFVSRKIILNGKEQVLKEDTVKNIENLIKGTGETLDQAIERIIIEYKEQKRQELEDQRLKEQVQKRNSLDYFLYAHPTHK
jgi:hypothetical protein